MNNPNWGGESLAERYHPLAAVFLDMNLVLAGQPTKGLHDRVAGLLHGLHEFSHGQGAMVGKGLSKTNPAFSPICRIHDISAVFFMELPPVQAYGSTYADYNEIAESRAIVRSEGIAVTE